MKTLIVENDVMTQCLLAKTLTERGHEVVSFENAEQAVLAYQREFYPVILVDAGLPGMGGLQFSRWVRSQPNGQRVYVLILTAPGKPADLREILDAGANDFIMRPLDTATLHVRFSVAEEQMKAFFERKQLEQSLQQNTDRLQQLLGLTGEAVWVMDASCHTTSVNPRLEELLGYDAEELNRHSVLDLCSEESCERVAEILARAAEGTESRAELVFRRKAGGTCPVLAAVAPLQGAGEGSIWVLNDISRLRSNEGELRRVQEEQERLSLELHREAAERQELLSQVRDLREQCDRAQAQLQTASVDWAEERQRFEEAEERAGQERQELLSQVRDLREQCERAQALLQTASVDWAEERQRFEEAEGRAGQERQELLSQVRELREQCERTQAHFQTATSDWAAERRQFEEAEERARQDTRTAQQEAADQQRRQESRIAELESAATREREEWERRLKAEAAARDGIEQGLAEARRQLEALERNEARAAEQARDELVRREKAEESLARLRQEFDAARAEWEGRRGELEKSLSEERDRCESSHNAHLELVRQHEATMERSREELRKADEAARQERQRSEGLDREVQRLQQELAESVQALRREQEKSQLASEQARVEAEALRAAFDRLRQESAERWEAAQAELLEARDGLEEERKGHQQTRMSLRQAEEALSARAREQSAELHRLNQELNSAFEERRDLQSAVIAARNQTAELLQKHNRELVAVGDELRAAINARVRSEEASATLLAEAESRANAAIRDHEASLGRLAAAEAEARQLREAATENGRQLEDGRGRMNTLQQELAGERVARERLEQSLKEQLERAEESSKAREAEAQRQKAELQARLDELSGERTAWSGRVEEMRQMNRRLQEEIGATRNESHRAARLLRLILELRVARGHQEVARVLANAAREIIPWSVFRFDLHETAVGRIRPVLFLSAATGEMTEPADVPHLDQLTPAMRKALVDGVQVVRANQAAEKAVVFAPVGRAPEEGGALVCTAIPGQSDQVGFVQLLTDAGPASSPTELRILEDLGRCAAFALERLAAEEMQRRSEQRLATLSRLTAEVLWDWEIASGRLWRNDAFQSVFGYTPEEVEPGVVFFEERLHPDDRERVMTGVRACLENGQESWQANYRFRRADGSYAHVQDRGLLVRDASGTPVRMVGAMVDVSQRKEFEEAMIEGQARKVAILESALDGIITIDHEGRVFEWNPTAERMFGHRRAEVLGRPLVELIIPPGGRVRHQEEVTRHLADGGAAIVGRRLEFTATRADGSEFPVELSLSRIPTDGDPIYTGFIRDFTERRRAEQEIQKLAAFPRWNPNPVFEIGADGSLNYYNDAARQMAAALGRSEPAALLPEGVGETVRECLREGQSKLRQETHVNGRVFSWSFFPILSGGVVHCYATEITERVTLEQQLRHSQKMESVGQLAAGVAHDFNNLLSIIQGYSVSLQEEKWLPPDASEALNQIYSAAQRAAHLTRQLLTFSRRSTLHIQTLDLNDAISNVSKLLRRVLGENVELKLDLSPALPAVEADVGMMEQVVMNLALNARDAMPGGGSLRIATRPAEVSRSHAQQNPEASPGTHLCLEVRDTGCGMDPATRERAFEPFFTTKPAGKGTGLGLATVYGIVKQHRGWIELESEVRQGTVFRIFLPASNKATPPATSQQPPQATASTNGGAVAGSETILVVEDEPAVLAMAKGVLQRQGYRVIGAPSGDEALPIWQKHRGEIDLLVTDVVMPGTINGRALAQKLRDGKPGLKVIYTSGYGTEILGPEAAGGNRCVFLPKPYHPDTLTQMVRECLAKDEFAAR